MRPALIILSTVISLQLFAQIKPGYDKKETMDMIAICNSFTFIDLYNSDAEILPEDYQKKYTSGVFGMDNKFQIYQKGSVAVINFRGSTAKKESWLENVYAAMIPARGTMKTAGDIFNYCFAQDTAAAVHSGFALAVAFLSNDIIFHINNLNREGIYDIILTGHSQGGSLANMMRACLENLSDNEISEKNRFKTYAFAAPMIGNDIFIDEYDRRFCDDQTSFTIINPEDPIPDFPLGNAGSDFSDQLKILLEDPDNFDPKQMLYAGLFSLFEDNIMESVIKLGHSASDQISKEVGPVEMPEYVQDISYRRTGNLIKIEPVVYPKMLNDSSILQNDSLMAIYKIGDNGHFINDELYKKEPWGYQHKPYNYYVSMLRLYYPSQYAILEKKYLPENL
ncbi:MAG: hypothetical protein JW894_12695 [Bacteroidales bacterium]|nr:hypothetical protein [Bacteroidales bacterium]